jgi:pimeloyl-ACP methyl ester carboxylesterase
MDLHCRDRTDRDLGGSGLTWNGVDGADRWHVPIRETRQLLRPTDDDVVSLGGTVTGEYVRPPQNTPIAMQYVKTSDDVNIAYLSLGEGPPIVFASNIFGDAHNYHRGWPHVRDVTDRLVGLGWRVVRYDHRGMGFSDRHVADLSFEARVRDLTAVVTQLGFERFALVGLDLGAPTAVAYAVQHQASVSRLVLLSPWASGVQMFALPDLRVAASAAPTGETAPENDREWQVFVQVLGSVATAFEERGLGVEAAENILQSTSPSGLAAYYKASACIDITALLPRVAVPTLVIHEPAFRFGSFALCQEVAAGIPDAPFVIVTDNSIAGRVREGHVTAIDQFLRSGTVRLVRLAFPQTRSPCHRLRPPGSRLERSKSSARWPPD